MQDSQKDKLQDQVQNQQQQQETQQKIIPIELPKSRSCTDFCCALLFFSYMIAFFGCGIYGLIEGDTNALIHYLDSDGKYCGTGNRENYPYLYQPTPMANGDYYRVCVKTCPQEWQSIISCHTNSFVPDCEF